MPSKASLAALALAALAAPSAAETLRHGDYDQRGLASWYGEETGARPTAAGVRFDPAAITVAHRTLPLGSWVEVTALASGRVILARVADRGPGRADRLVDLSRGAARLLGTDRSPVAAIRLRTVAAEPGRMTARLLHPGLPSALAPALAIASRYNLQVASFSSEPRARRLATVLGGAAVRGGVVWRVHLGPFTSAPAVQRARDAVAARGYGDAQILPLD